MKRLENQIAIITGGSSGIGKVAVQKFADEGALVIIWDLDEESAKKIISESTDQRIDFVKVDVANINSVQNACEIVIKKYSQIDILINNAGVTRDSTLLKMSPEQWQKVIDVNLTGVFNCTKIVIPYMIEKNYGRIVNTSSVVGIYGNYGQTNYVATKSGIIGMTKVWARELGRKGINVNAVAPGFIATEMVDTIPEKILNAIKDKTPLSRLGDPMDIANAYLFLVSDEAKFITGTTLSVDGGLVL